MPQQGESSDDYHFVAEGFWEECRAITEQYGLRPADLAREGLPWKTAQNICDGTHKAAKMNKGTARKLQRILSNPEEFASGLNEPIENFNSFLNMDFEDTKVA